MSRAPCAPPEVEGFRLGLVGFEGGFSRVSRFSGLGFEGSGLACQRNSVERRKGRVRSSHRTTFAHLYHSYLRLVDLYHAYLRLIDLYHSYLRLIDWYHSYLRLIDLYQSYLRLIDLYHSYLRLIDFCITQR